MSRSLMLTLFTLAFALTGVKAQNNVSFIEEYIDFGLNNEYFEINGVYLFYNPTDRFIAAAIRFPFAMDADSIDVDRVYNLAENRSIDYRKFENNIDFRVGIPPSDTVAVNICYRQPLDKVNTYIITSTRAWKKPLSRAKYSLTVDESIKIKSFSYLPDSLSGNLYFWEKTEFFPDKEFVITLE